MSIFQSFKLICYFLLIFSFTVLSGCKQGPEWILERPQKTKVKGMPKRKSDLKSWLIKRHGGDEKGEIEDYGYRAPTEEELSLLAKSFTLDRHYPKKTKGVFQPGSHWNRILIGNYLDELNAMGLNSYSVLINLGINQQGAVVLRDTINRWNFSVDPWPAVWNRQQSENAIIHTILLAKKAGYAVFLSPDIEPFLQLEPGQYLPEHFGRQFEAMALQWAEIAEKYKVEYFAPMAGHAYAMHTSKVSHDKIIKETRDFYNRVIPKVREIYKGKIYFRVSGGATGLYFLDRAKVAGLADLIGVEFSLGSGKSKEMETYVAKITQMAETVSMKHQKPYFIAHFQINHYPSKMYDPMGSFYSKGLKALLKTGPNSQGLHFTSYLSGLGVRGTREPGSDAIRGTMATDSVRRYFEKLK
ncbi:hypothetical protein ACFL6Y_09690 [Elusimicrobiota bacterium]